MDIEVSEEFKVKCMVCGKALEAEIVAAIGGRVIEVEPCDGCLRDAEANGETNAKMDAEAGS